MKKKIKKVFPYIVTIVVVLMIFISALFVTHTYPFGDRNLAKFDALYQYQPMLYNFIINMRNGTLKSFNFLNGLGNPTIFNFLYYLASPINLICLLFSKPETMFF